MSYQKPLRNYFKFHNLFKAPEITSATSAFSSPNDQNFFDTVFALKLFVESLNALPFAMLDEFRVNLQDASAQYQAILTILSIKKFRSYKAL